MATARVTVRIGRPVAEVFDFMSHYDNNVRWQDGVTESRQLTPGEPAVGTKVTYTRNALGRSMTTTSTLVELEKDRKLRMESSSGPIQYRGGYDFFAEGEGTRVEYQGEITTSRLLGPVGVLVAKGFQRAMEGDLQRLKALLEG